MRRTYAICVAFGIMASVSPSNAAVSPDEIKRFDSDLTPMGAERAGNAAGTIPAWEGGITAPPPGLGYKPGDHHPDPFAADQPLYTVTPANMAQYDAVLTDGNKGLLTAYPDTYFMKVYPSRRSCAFPPRVYEAIKRNAANAQLASNGDSVTGATIASPFPIPQSARELIWNHELRYQGFKVRRESVSAVPTKGGDYTLDVSIDQWMYDYANPELSKTEDLDNVIFHFLKLGVSPNNNAGSVMVMHNTLNQVQETRRNWLYRPGARKVVRNPGASHDSFVPISEGIRTSDNMQVFNGAADRFDWEIMGKQEKLIPYNVYKFNSPDLQYKDILTKNHLNQEPIRYELHRVWALEGKLKKDKTHVVTSRRRIFIDEDSWIAVATALFDKNDKLARAQEGFVSSYYEHPLCAIGSDIVYDVTGNRYHIIGLRNQEKEINFDAQMNAEMFSPGGMRSMGVR